MGASAWLSMARDMLPDPAQPNLREPPLCFSSFLAFLPFPINSKCPARSPSSASVLVTMPEVYFFCSLSALVDLGFLTFWPFMGLAFVEAGGAFFLISPWAMTIFVWDSALSVSCAGCLYLVGKTSLVLTLQQG